MKFLFKLLCIAVLLILEYSKIKMVGFCGNVFFLPKGIR